MLESKTTNFFKVANEETQLDLDEPIYNGKDQQVCFSASVDFKISYS